MRITSNHPLARHGLVVGQQINHNGISYTVVNEDYRSYELESDNPLTAWKKRTVY